MEYELIVHGGTVVDGSGAPRFQADIAIEAGRIAEVIADTQSEQVNASREIDARGLVVAPGFIDPHSHSDWVAPIPEHASILKPFIMQGVTTFVGGNCGFSTAPIRREHAAMLNESGRLCAEREFHWKWERVSELGARLKSQGMALNVAHLAGHGSIRLSVMGASAAKPDWEQLRAMQAMVEQ